MSADTMSVTGVQYALPSLDLEFAVTRRLIDCSSSAAATGGQAITPTFEVKVEPKQDFVASQVFTMDYSSLSAPWKTSSFKVEWYDNRMLKSFNVQATDQSSEIILQTLEAGIAVAKLAGGIPPGAAAPGSPTATCPAEVGLRKIRLSDRKTATKALTDATVVIDSYKGRDAATLGAAAKKTLDDALHAVRTQTEAIAEINKELAELDKVLAYTETVRWHPPTLPTSPNERSKIFDFEVSLGSTAVQAARARWVMRLFSVGNLIQLGIADANCSADVDANGLPKSFLCRLERSLTMVVALEPEVVSPADVAATHTALGIAAPAASRQPRRDHVQGVVTRIPVRSRLLGCSGTVSLCQPTSPEKILDQRVWVPQFGHYLILPFSNGFGQDNELSVNFAENGVPTMVDYKEKRAAGLVAAQTLNQGLGSVLQYAADVREFREAEEVEEKGAALEAAENQVKLLQQQQQIVTLQAGLDPANAALAAQKSRLTDQLAIAQLERDIAKVEDEIEDLDRQLAVQPGDLALQAERDRLATRVAILRAQGEIAEFCSANPNLAGC